MIIKGFQQLTLIDFPKKLAAIIFTAGCNWRCHYCYNKSLAFNSPELPIIEEDKIFEFLKKRKGLLDGIVITGGEPTIHKDLPKFIQKIKNLNFLVKLDTNGTNPEMIKYLIERNLIDYIAMDIKNSLNKYEETVAVKVDKEKIKETIKTIISSNVDYEFRTTTLPKLMSKEDFIEISKLIKGSKKYCLQQFKAMKNLIDPSYTNEKNFTEPELIEIKNSLKDHFKEIEIRC